MFSIRGRKGGRQAKGRRREKGEEWEKNENQVLEMKDCLQVAKLSGMKMLDFAMDIAFPLCNSGKAESQNWATLKCDNLASYLAAPKSIYEGKNKGA